MFRLFSDTTEGVEHRVCVISASLCFFAGVNRVHCNLTERSAASLVDRPDMKLGHVQVCARPL